MVITVHFPENQTQFDFLTQIERIDFNQRNYSWCKFEFLERNNFYQHRTRNDFYQIQTKFGFLMKESISKSSRWEKKQPKKQWIIEQKTILPETPKTSERNREVFHTCDSVRGDNQQHRRREPITRGWKAVSMEDGVCSRWEEAASRGKGPDEETRAVRDKKGINRKFGLISR